MSKVITNRILIVLVFLLSNFPIVSIANTSNINRIIIDPKYGGKESGPISYSKELYAKDITLSIAMKLGTKIKEGTDYEVIYTRKSDNYISLHDRVSIANRNHGDVFISIGANGSTNKDANGLEIFTFRVLSVENNKEELVRKYSGKKSFSEAMVIIEDLLSSTKTKSEDSIDLANYIHIELIEEVGIKDRGIKSASYYELIGVQMPAVMIMVGFLTNLHDEKLLKESTFQDKIAEALFKGILKYFQTKKEKRGK